MRDPYGLTARGKSVLASTARSHYTWAATFFVVLVVTFFSPVFRSHATFSAVANLQRYYYPWIDPMPATPPDPLSPQADQADYVYPRQVFLDTTLRRTGELPLWNPMTLGGTPFAAQAGSRLAYPPMLAVTYLLNPVHAHDVYVMFHLFVAGLAMFALMKGFGVGFSGALLSATSWAFASYTLAWIMLEMFAAVAAWLPLALLLVYRWRSRDSIRDLIAATLILGLLLLGTSLELALLVFLVVIGYAGSLILRRLVTCRSELRWRDIVTGLAQPALLALGSLAIAAVVMLPFMALSNSSQRGAPSLSQQLSLSVPASAFAKVLKPPDIPPDVAGRVMALISNQVFVGTATVCLAVVGLVRRRAGRGLGAALALLIYLFATGSAVARATYEVVPLLGRLTGAGRSLFVFSLGVAILGGLGLDTALRALRRIGPTVTTVRRRWAPDLSPSRALAVVVAIACIAATSLQLLSYGRRVNPPFQSRSASQLFPPTPVIEAVKDVIGRSAGRERVLVVSPVSGTFTLVSTTGLALDLPLANGYEPVVPANVSAIWRVVNGEPASTAFETSFDQTFQIYFLSSSVRTELLGRLGVAAVVAPPGEGLGPGWSEPEAARRGLQRTYVGTDGQVFAVNDRAPRAVVVDDVSWVGTQREALARFTSPEFDVRRQVVLEGALPGDSATSRQSNAPVPAQVDWLQDDPNQVRVSVTTTAAGWLVLLDNWAPGWTATVGGAPARVERANFTQRAVRVPAGTSTIAFSYRPSDVRYGAWVSSLSAGTLTAVLLFMMASRRRRPPVEAV